MDDQLKRIWNQQKYPVLVRRQAARLRARVPYFPDDVLWIGRTQHWLRAGRRQIPEWCPKRHFWEVPAKWFNDLVIQMLGSYDGVYVIQPLREQEICASQCWNAHGHECQCSCMGQNHGQGRHGNWLEVSETFATRWGETKIACRLLTERTAN